MDVEVIKADVPLIDYWLARASRDLNGATGTARTDTLAWIDRLLDRRHHLTKGDT
ncbi:hypothetical protein [Tomitella gaofuii]|uniref:hypothetical protein n=1 Tax=Tomitella gaofuii TaxID=2760083 RepID=UPI0015FBBE9F|nr:hypothetical protein [Tomitella gaofuii]